MNDPEQNRWTRAVDRDVRGRGVCSEAVLAALRETDRRNFLPKRYADDAAFDGPLPIGSGQTISQPYIVGVMTEWAAPAPDHRVLEIGTGSGFQAAVLSRLVREVYTVERVAGLARSAEARFRRMGLRNIFVRTADGYHGWKDAAPFDAIVVTAACPDIPPPWAEQLRPGGRLVVPVGPANGEQILYAFEAEDGGRLQAVHQLSVRFVPFIRGTTAPA